MSYYPPLGVHLDFDKIGIVATTEYDDCIIQVVGSTTNELNEKIVKALVLLGYKGYVRLNYLYDSSVILMVNESTDTKTTTIE